MLELFLDYALFLAKAATVAVVIVIVLSSAAALAMRSKQGRAKGYIEVNRMNTLFDSYKYALHEVMLPPPIFKKYIKQQAKDEKQQAKDEKKATKKAAASKEDEHKKRLFYITFKGDIHASAAEGLRHEVSSVLTSADDHDEVLVSIESGGGMVSNYGFAASQLQRILDKGLSLTVAVDKIAASGGYLMACVSNKIIAAPYAMIGSVGVLAQVPNFHKLLQEHNIDMDVYTAGEFKRQVTIFGENTEAGKQKFQETLEDIHDQFKNTILKFRPHLDMEKVATGEAWLAEQAQALGLVDELMTSDAYLMAACETSDVLEIKWVLKTSPAERLMNRIETSFKQVLNVAKRPFHF